MKKVLFMICAVAGVLSMASCGSQKKAVQEADMVEVNIPLSGAEYQSDNEYYRAVQTGESINMSMAKKVALQNARQELAAAIKADLSQVIENYAKNQTVGTANDYQDQYQELAYTVIEQQLVGASVAGEKMYKKADGKYQYNVCLQLSKEELKNKVAEKISADEELKLEFDLDRFRKVYNEQMENYKNQNK